MVPDNPSIPPQFWCQIFRVFSSVLVPDPPSILLSFGARYSEYSPQFWCQIIRVFSSVLVPDQPSILLSFGARYSEYSPQFWYQIIRVLDLSFGARSPTVSCPSFGVRSSTALSGPPHFFPIFFFHLVVSQIRVMCRNYRCAEKNHITSYCVFELWVSKRGVMGITNH